MMSRQLQAKYCPRCRTMNRLEAESCTHCEYQFHQGLASQVQTEEQKNRTQMFTLSQLPQLPTQSAHPPPPPSFMARWSAILSNPRSSSLLLAIIMLGFVIAGLLWLAYDYF